MSDRTRGSYLVQSDFDRLEDWCRMVRAIFGSSFGPYLVGSALQGPDYRDVDIRVILRDRVFDRLFRGRLEAVRYLNRALSVWGRAETGLPIDFQVQRQTEANASYPHRRNAMGVRDWSRIPTSGVPAALAAQETPSPCAFRVRRPRVLRPTAGGPPPVPDGPRSLLPRRSGDETMSELLTAANDVRKRHAPNEYDVCVACREMWPCAAELLAELVVTVTTLDAARQPTVDVEALRGILDSMPGLYGGITGPDGRLHPDFTLGVAEYVVAALAAQEPPQRLGSDE